MKRWELTWCKPFQAGLYLQAGWEPFAVTGHAAKDGEDRLYLRRPVLDLRAFGDTEDER